jgi:hypothetical protein
MYQLLELSETPTTSEILIYNFEYFNTRIQSLQKDSHPPETFSQVALHSLPVTDAASSRLSKDINPTNFILTLSRILSVARFPYSLQPIAVILSYNIIRPSLPRHFRFNVHNHPTIGHGTTCSVKMKIIKKLKYQLLTELNYSTGVSAFSVTRVSGLEPPSSTPKTTQYFGYLFCFRPQVKGREAFTEQGRIKTVYFRY